MDFAAEGFLAPTNADEHILCWALHLARAQAHGGCGRPVALLTEDLALKIKANASGVACDTAGAMAALPAARLPTATPLSSAPNAGTVLVEDPSLRHRAAAPQPPAAAPPSAYAMQIARHLAERAAAEKAAAERAAAERAAAEKAAAERAAARVAVVGGSEAPRSALLPPPTLPIAPPPLPQPPSSRPVPAAAPVALRRGAASVGALTLTAGSVAEKTTAAAETLTPPLPLTRTRTLRPSPKA